jgi:hypothetical protein
MANDPFAALGLPARAGLSDEDVRAAWRRIAAATHPDREDGGDPGRFGAAAAAYETLRTSFGRGEALADLAAGWVRRARHRARHGTKAGGRRPRRPVSWPGLLRVPGLAGAVVAERLARHGRPWRLAARMAVAAAVSASALIAAGWTPGTVGVLAGMATWLLAASALHSR